MTQLNLFGGPANSNTTASAVQHPVTTPRPRIVLRDYQQASVDAVFEDFKQFSSTLVQLPTGCGKSVVFSAVMKRFREEQENARCN